jgi:anti-sigma regulatory factor (Ser/Thr protein kinase)
MNKDFGEELMSFHFKIDGDSFTSAGQASMSVKKSLGQLGIAPDIIRKVSIAMYEGEINMVIHAEGGTADVTIYENAVKIFLQDEGPGIADVEKAMQEGFSTAPDTIRSLGFGAGMGLPNMRKNADDMFVESTVGVGTKVTIIVNY